MKIKCGHIAIVGKPNAGKSTLVNSLVKEKVSIVSPKAQTTRGNILGILNDNEYQLIFIDTPGINMAKTKLDDFMQKNVRSATDGVEAIIVCVDGTKRIDTDEQKMIDRYTETGLPVVVAITKIDELTNVELFEKLSKLNNLQKVKDIVPVSAMKSKNIETLTNVLLKFVPEVEENQRFYDDDTYTDKSLRFIVAEIIREKSLYFLDKEIPHGIAVEIVKYEEQDKLINIDANIICEKDSHKSIIIGRSGTMLKKIGHAARVSIQKVVQAKVDINLFIKVKPGWRNNDGFLNDIGYNI